MKKVVKFGGSSLASAEQFRKVGDIIRSDEARRFVVPSAPGKRFDGDTKVTDMLYKCYAAAEAGEKFGKLLEDIQPSSLHYEEARRLLKFLDYFLGISSEDIPKNSLLREFIG